MIKLTKEKVIQQTTTISNSIGEKKVTLIDRGEGFGTEKGDIPNHDKVDVIYSENN